MHLKYVLDYRPTSKKTPWLIRQLSYKKTPLNYFTLAFLKKIFWSLLFAIHPNIVSFKELQLLTYTEVFHMTHPKNLQLYKGNFSPYSLCAIIKYHLNFTSLHFFHSSFHFPSLWYHPQQPVKKVLWCVHKYCNSGDFWSAHQFILIPFRWMWTSI